MVTKRKHSRHLVVEINILLEGFTVKIEVTALKQIVTKGVCGPIVMHIKLGGPYILNV